MEITHFFAIMRYGVCTVADSDSVESQLTLEDIKAQYEVGLWANDLT